MAIELGKYVVGGELLNTQRNRVHGWLALRGVEDTLHVEFAGNCEPDLAGQHIRFKPRQEPAADFDARSIRHFQHRQIGPVGKMTAALTVQVDAAGHAVPPGSAAAVSGDFQPCLHLEWFGQNGRMVVVLVAPVIQVVGPAEKEGEREFFAGIIDFGPPPGQAAQELLLPPEVAAAAPDDANLDDDLDDFLAAEEADATSLLPAGLQRELDRQTAALDRQALGTADEDDIWRDLELWEDLHERSNGVPLQDIITDAGPLPEPDTLNENQAQVILKVLLARLAVSGIAVDLCEHVTALDVYRLLLQKMGTEGGCYEGLRGSGWVQHFSTYEYCDQCAADHDLDVEDVPF